jgi:hypothetical protein
MCSSRRVVEWLLSTLMLLLWWELQCYMDVYLLSRGAVIHIDYLLWWKQTVTDDNDICMIRSVAINRTLAYFRANVWSGALTYVVATVHWRPRHPSNSVANMRWDLNNSEPTGTKALSTKAWTNQCMQIYGLVVCQRAATSESYIPDFFSMVFPSIVYIG